jgi:hypothetical protein
MRSVWTLTFCSISDFDEKTVMGSLVSTIPQQPFPLQQSSELEVSSE